MEKFSFQSLKNNENAKNAVFWHSSAGIGVLHTPFIACRQSLQRVLQPVLAVLHF